MRRLLTLAALLAALFGNATAIYADDGSGCDRPQPYLEQIYGDTAR